MSSLAWSIMLSKASVGSFSQGSINPGPSELEERNQLNCKCDTKWWISKVWHKQGEAQQIKRFSDLLFHISLMSDLVVGCQWRCILGLCAWPLLGWADLQHCWSLSPPAAPSPGRRDIQRDTDTLKSKKTLQTVDLSLLIGRLFIKHLVKTFGVDKQSPYTAIQVMNVSKYNFYVIVCRFWL